MAWRVCTRPGCGTLHEGTGRCPGCRRAADKARRPQGNPYTTRGHLAFREAVLARHPRCVCTGECGHHDGYCGQPSTVADHHPIERVDLIAQGLDPNDPSRGRGVCKHCHDAKTARTRR
jgi:5-methylcytosine-specific restriction protein A